MEDTLKTNVHDGARIGAGTETIVTPNIGKRMRVLGFRLQVHTVTVPGVVELVGRSRTKISGEVYVDANGINYVQDRIRVEMGDGEVMRLRNTSDGTVQWAVFIEDFASVGPDLE